MPRPTEADADDLWRGSRLLLAAAVIGIGALVLIAVRFERSPDPSVELNALVASFDLAAERPQRFALGLVTNDGEVLAHGDVMLSFSFLGQEGADPVPGPTATATWQPIAGTTVDEDAAHPMITDDPGVYVARDVAFDRPGFWQVELAVYVEGERLRAEAAFEVVAEHLLPAIGDEALRTVQPLATDGRDATTIDSRASETEPVPDPDLHDRTVADAIASGRPTMLVVSTPTFCSSRFCGPITEAVEALERRFGEQMAFVHLEVWQDFDAKKLNPASEEWIRPPGSEEATEPWVWVIDEEGQIVERFDNAASDVELEDAVTAVLR